MIGSPSASEQFISDHTKELIQEAAETAVRFGRREVDTEHLLYALAGSDVTAAILKAFKLTADDLRGYIDANAPKGDEPVPDEGQVDVRVSPRVKAVLEHAFEVRASWGTATSAPSTCSSPWPRKTRAWLVTCSPSTG